MEGNIIMFYYAELNTVTRIVVQVFQTENAIFHADYVELESLDTSLVGKKYDAETGNFVDPQPQDLKAHTTDEIAYKTQNKWLSTKLDEMDVAIASSGGGGGSSVFEIADGTDSYKLKITDSTLANTADGTYAFAMGVCNTAYSFNTVLGKFAKDDIVRGYQSNMSGDSFVIGNGTKSVTSGVTTKSNGFRVTQEGKVYGAGEYNSSGADYAECFEWYDGNTNNEERLGKFVTLDGNKIKIANAIDYVLGVVTAHSSVIGNNPIDWSGRFQKDIFGRVQLDSEGIPLTVSNYDETQAYIERTKRKEWATVGLLGQLVVEDDGTCDVNSYCNVLAGIATHTSANYGSYRVLKRLDDNHILILFR